MMSQTRPVRATYRLQLRNGMDLDRAAALVPYLSRLGVSHLHLSPPFAAVAGSTHGYDVVQPNAIDSGIGGVAGFRRLASVAADHGLGLVIDIVPNHMAVLPAANPWLWDVLEKGPASEWSTMFDIRWDGRDRRLDGRVSLPVLSKPYGEALRSGAIRLIGGADDVRPPALDADGTLLPLCRESVAVLRGARPAAELVHDVLQRQHYRLAYWRDIDDELDFRRFFAINELIGVRQEVGGVFAATHRFVAEAVCDGLVDGLRVDHVDGLADPGRYLRRLAAATPGAWIVVEKILARDEEVPDRWPIAGTTGYDFAAVAGGLAIDPAGYQELVASWVAMSGRGDLCGDDEGVSLAAEVFGALRREARREVLADTFASELRQVAVLAAEAVDDDIDHRGPSVSSIAGALTAFLVELDRYRTYLVAGEVTRCDDAAACHRALRRARKSEDVDGRALDVLGALLSAAGSAGSLPPDRARALATFVIQVQQLESAVAAKAVEDRAFYRFPPLLAVAEVGTEPERPTTTVEQFHRWCGAAARRPGAMLALSTHDTKRSEDVRARIAVLSQIPGTWLAYVGEWRVRHRRFWTVAPDLDLELTLYQTLVGAHPIATERLVEAMVKSAREAARRTCWTDPDIAYEDALERFVGCVVADGSFVHDLEHLLDIVLPAGRAWSLAQRLLLLCSPGIPDLYQGTEVWNSALVDPDNRRPVPFGQIDALLTSCRDGGCESLSAYDDPDDLGSAKLRVTWCALDLRRRRPALFGVRGAYAPLAVHGPGREGIVAFTRGDGAAVVVPTRMPQDRRWSDTTVDLPPGRWIDLLTREDLAGGETHADLLLGRGLPVALLERPEP